MKKDLTRLWNTAFLAGVLSAVPHVATAEFADVAYVNGRIYTVDGNQPWAEAVAIRDGRFIAVGSPAAMGPFIGDKTGVIDLGGRFVMPGVHDLHIHPVSGMLTELYSCDLPSGAKLSEITEGIETCIKARAPGTWIRGGLFAAQLLDFERPLHRSMLDAVAPDHPVILRSSGGHTVWANSAALRLAGIDANTPDPEGGFIRRDTVTGEPTGLLHEAAGELVQDKVPDYTTEEYATAVATFARVLNRQGVTSIKDASVTPELLDVYQNAETSGALTLRVAANLTLRPDAELLEQHMTLVKSWQQQQTSRIKTSFVKIFVDGSAGSHKAAFLEPYLKAPQHEAGYTGEFLVPPNLLKEYLVRLDRAGVSVKMHCGGDAAVRAALNAIEAARRSNGDSDILHEISHPNLVAPEDMPRFRALGVIADLTPVTWYPNPILEFLTRALGSERVQRMWQIRTFVESGVIAVYGSDWPAITPNTNPWRAMEAMITRRNPDTDSGDPFAAEQAIDLATAIRIFTHNGAKAMRQEDEVGTIEVGKYADMVVLGKNPFEMPPGKLDRMSVIMTLLAGVEVYRDEAQLR